MYVWSVIAIKPLNLQNTGQTDPDPEKRLDPAVGSRSDRIYGSDIGFGSKAFLQTERTSWHGVGSTTLIHYHGKQQRARLRTRHLQSDFGWISFWVVSRTKLGPYYENWIFQRPFFIVSWQHLWSRQRNFCRFRVACGPPNTMSLSTTVYNHGNCEQEVVSWADIFRCNVHFDFLAPIVAKRWQVATQFLCRTDKKSRAGQSNWSRTVHTRYRISGPRISVWLQSVGQLVGHQRSEFHDHVWNLYPRAELTTRYILQKNICRTQ